MENQNPVYLEKLDRLNKTIEKGTADRVPVLPIMETWAAFYGGANLEDAYVKNPNTLFNAYKKINETIYLDGILENGNLIPLKMMSNFGEGIYTLTDKGFVTKGSEGATMDPSEYPELVKNPLAFFANVIAPRKYPILKEDPEKNLDRLRKAFGNFMEFLQFNGQVDSRIENELGLPVLAKGVGFLTPDMILDFLRDFVGVSLDLRRHPEEFLAACDAIFEPALEMTLGSYPIADKSGVVFSPLHLPTFLKPKDFERFYFPFMYKFVEEVAVKRGYRIFFFMENDWTPYLSILQGLPDADIIGLFEGGDLKQIKASIGNKFCIWGGMPLSLLRLGTEQECIDKAKECLDLYAPGGNYVFSTDMNLLSLEDAKPENLKAVCQYVHENGKY
ncbi:uroporphyrinogen decarboxylase family protein [Eubacterium limosum]|uniref:uroporphyrinogen decarboxylase family protein n=1 Tax=Eubacterium limosum TaxID=1736 RepID=UPI003719C4BD